MTETKPAHRSVGIIGAVAVLVTAVLNALEVDVDAGKVTEWLIAGSTFIGGLAALYGRWRATKQIEGV